MCRVFVWLARLIVCVCVLLFCVFDNRFVRACLCVRLFVFDWLFVCVVACLFGCLLVHLFGRLLVCLCACLRVWCVCLYGLRV